jgi:hypothetical protein
VSTDIARTIALKTDILRVDLVSKSKLRIVAMRTSILRVGLVCTVT